MRTALYRIAEVSPNTFAVTPCDSDAAPERMRDAVVIRIEDIPDGTNAAEITRYLTRLPDLARPPIRFKFAELKILVENIT